MLRLLPALLIVLATGLVGCGTFGGQPTHPSPVGPVSAEDLESGDEPGRFEQAPEPPAPSAEQAARNLVREGDAARNAGRRRDAVTAYRMAALRHPESPVARERIAYMELRAGSPQAAAKQFLAIVEEHDRRARSHLGLGLARLALREPEAAVAPLERARKLDKRSADVRAALGVAYDKVWRQKDAQREYRKALKIRPADFDSWNNLGVSYLATESYADALTAFDEAAKLRGQERAVQNNRGIALAWLGHWDDALDAFRRGGSEAQAQNNLGYLHYLNENHTRAIEHYELALAKRPKNRAPIVRNLSAARTAKKREEKTR